MISVLQLQSEQTQRLLLVPAGPGLPKPDEADGPFASWVRDAAQR